jgi:hypothetical protein
MTWLKRQIGLCRYAAGTTFGVAGAVSYGQIPLGMWPTFRDGNQMVECQLIGEDMIAADVASRVVAGNDGCSIDRFNLVAMESRTSFLAVGRLFLTICRAVGAPLVAMFCVVIDCIGAQLLSIALVVIAVDCVVLLCVCTMCRVAAFVARRIVPVRFRAVYAKRFQWLRQATLRACLHCDLPSRYVSAMRRTNSATDIPNRSASIFRNSNCGSVKEIICFFIPTVYHSGHYNAN